MKSRNIIYFGAPAFSAEILASLLGERFSWDGGPKGLPAGRQGLLPGETALNIVGIVTTPDKPLGRKQILTPSPVAQSAAKHDLPVFKPEKLDEANLAHLKLLKPDIFLVVSYGKIIPPAYLSAAKTLNVHFSLLPKYRGALCIQEALKNGDTETGVTLMEMEEKLDAGPVIARIKVPITLDDNVATLTEKLTHAAKQLLKYELPIYLDGAVAASPQDETKASYTPSLKTNTRANAFLDWEVVASAMSGNNAPTIHNLIRSRSPDPGAWTNINGQELKLIQTTVYDNHLVIETVQIPGKKAISWENFNRGLR